MPQTPVPQPSDIDFAGTEPERIVGEERGRQLFVLTLLLELPGVLVRWLLLSLLSLPIYLSVSARNFSQDPFGLGLGGQGSSLGETFLTLYSWFTLGIAWLPLIFSLFSYRLLPGGYILTRFALGARDPSLREREALKAALEEVTNGAPPKTIAPTKWFVVDTQEANAFVVGTTLYVTRELIRSDFLARLLAHELGHLNSSDGKLILALRRLILPPVYLMSQSGGQIAPGTVIVVRGESDTTAYLRSAAVWFVSFLLSLAGGGFGLWLLSPFWVWYWRGREYSADQFAASCGFASGLIEYLERYQFFDVATPYFLSSHPYTELRIDRLMAYQGDF